MNFSVLNVALLKDAAKRAVNTGWQVVASLAGAGQVDLFALSWTHIAESALGAAALSAVKTLAAAGLLGNSTPATSNAAQIPSVAPATAGLDTSIEPGAAK